MLPDRLGGMGPCDEGLGHELGGVLLGDHLQDEGDGGGILQDGFLYNSFAVTGSRRREHRDFLLVICLKRPSEITHY